MEYFPLFASLRGRRVVIIGGGEVAARKARLLARAGADLSFVAPVFSPELQEWAEQHDARLVRQEFEPVHLQGQMLVIAATDNHDCNARVARAANARGIFCNVVDDPALASFIMPAIVDRSPVTVAISTAGRAPVLARAIKTQLERLLPARLGAVAEFAYRWRDSVKNRLKGFDARRRFWEEVLDGPVAETVLAGNAAGADALLRHALTHADSQQTGIAYLVGAGPGDADLITLRALQVLQRAEVILHDSLVSQSVLDLARRDAEFINVGKRAGHRRVEQETTNALLVELVRAGKRVVRLKGGDPFIFGRGGEEVAALAAAGLPFQVIPGITAATGCGAYAGIPLTLRGVADAVTLVTARGSEPDDEPDWPALARSQTTLVFYMAVSARARIGRQLIAAGLDSNTPAAVVSQGTTTEQKVVTTTVAELSTIDAADIAKPALIIVGRVAALADVNEWFVPRALTRSEPTFAATG